MSLTKIEWKYLLLLLIPALVLLLAKTPLFQNYELVLYDFRLQLRPLQPVSDKIAIIEIDDGTLQRLGNWPLPRDFHASLIDVLDEAQVEAIIFDLIFSEPTRHDRTFAGSMQRAGNVYVPQAFDIESGAGVAELYLKPHEPLTPLADVLVEHVRGIGHINVVVDPDGKIRRTVAYVKADEGFVPQLGLLGACHHLGLDCRRFETSRRALSVDEKMKIPVTHGNELMVNYPGKWKDTFHHYSYFAILKDYQLWKEKAQGMGSLAELKDKICFIATTAVGTTDLRGTPLESNYPMIGLHASVLNSILTRSFIHKAPRALNVAAVVALFALAAYIGVRLSPLNAFFGSLILGLAYFAATTASLIVTGYWLDAFAPLVVIAATYVSCSLWRWLKDKQERQLLEKEMTVAADIQNQFLVSTEKAFEGYHIAKWFQPARYCAGDLYDIFRTDDGKAGLFVGDVSGKGLPAALLMSQAISSFRIFSRQTQQPHETMVRLNKVLVGQAEGRFVTALFCLLDREKGEITASSAGVGEAFLYRIKEERMEKLTFPPKTPLGIKAGTEYETLKFSMNAGDCLILFSDGLIEARNKEAQEFGEERLKQAVLESPGKSADELLEYLKSTCEEFCDPNLRHDDITLIVASAQ